MIELVAEIWGTKVTAGAVTVELDGLGTNRIGALICQLDSGLSQTEESSLILDTQGFFEVISETRPTNVELGGNILIEAEDPNNIGLWQYSWNPVSKILKGRVAL
ncbi:MAG: hypothetical protein ACRC8Y_09345 [Chroococcales cyanobacterium]